MVGIKFGKALALAMIFSASVAKSEVLFEGYARVFGAGHKAIGYAVSRYEFDAKTKKFISINLLKTDASGSEITESLKAYADDKFHPLSYSYTSIAGKVSKTIDAKFVGTKMTALVKTGGKSQTVHTTITPNTILSTFLAYTMLAGPKGIQTNNSYHYSAIAEEIPEKVFEGDASVLKEEDFLGLKAFKIKNDFQGHFTSYINGRGEVLGTSNDDAPISTELMADPAKATEGFAVNKAVLKALFGEVPEGTNNLVSKSASMKNGVPGGKAQDLPAGQGIQTKPAPDHK